MASAVQVQLHEKEQQFNKLLLDSSLIRKVFAEGMLDEESIAFLNEQPYYLYAYDGQSLLFWNNNKLLADCSAQGSGTSGNLLYNDRGVFVRKCILLPQLGGKQQLTVLFPILVTYPIENSYLKSQFSDATFIPLSTKVLPSPEKGSYPVHSLDKKVSFHLLFSPADIPDWVPDHIMIALLALALIASIMWLQIFTIYLTRKQSFHVGFIITLVIVLGVRYITYLFGYPFNLDSLPLFSPQLYASSSLLPSLGDLILNALCFLWLVVFIIRHTPYNVFKGREINKYVRYLLAVGLSLALIWYSFGFTSVIRSLVLDSMISFDVSHFYSISRYTIAGLFVIGIITGTSCLVIYLFHAQLTALISNDSAKYIIVAISGILLILLRDSYEDAGFLYVLTTWLLLFLYLLDRKRLVYNFDLLSPHMIFWAVFVCGFCTGILQYFNYMNEREERMRFAETIVQQRDDIMAYTFKSTADNILKDLAVRDFLQYPLQENRRSINERFDALYLGGHLNRYQSKVLFFDKDKKPLYNSDTISYNTLQGRLPGAEPVTDSLLYYREDALDGHYYLAYIPVLNRKDSFAQGYIFIDFMVKESGGESVYPELLQPGTVKGSHNVSGYSYGIYVNNKLITQTKDYAFPIYLNRPMATGTHDFYDATSYSQLFYKADDSKTVIVVRVHRMWLETITLFSYLFGMQMLVVIMVMLYRVFLSNFTKSRFSGKLIDLTLRRRIHFSMLGIVLVSFLIIGVVTIIYSILLYQQSNRKKLELVMQLVERTAQQYMKDKNAMDNAESFEKEITTPAFKYFITTLANAQIIDINIFSASGIMKVTSQENIYDKALLARIIQSDAYYALYQEKKSIHIQEERIGKLTYLSCYVPLWSGNGQVLGFINIPFFSSEKELSFQISNILVALINLYGFIFLISSLLTVFITRWLTRTLSIVINRFERLSFTRNELIDWPYDDEIGLLVKEYNKMVRKVEENAAMLAQNEREGAWREMAQQVAHEIKNPLTPMKLNIQYLQQALKKDHPNVKELAARVAESLIEQIDNLSYIASEFSNFAKMPEARPEEIELNELLGRIVELYLNEQNIKVTLNEASAPLTVYADRSQLLRIFTNLIENAVQAIPEDRTGHIAVSIKQEDGYAIITCADNGIGIPAAAVERIFQPYFTTKTSGTGLGLAMTKKIIEFWKGAIWFETEENTGTTFYIRMPLMKQIAE